MSPGPEPAVHPMRASAAELAPVPSLECLGRDRLLRLSLGLAFLHLVIACGHILNPAGLDFNSPATLFRDASWSRIPSWVLSVASACFLLVLRLLLPRLPLRWAHPLATLVSTLVVLNALGWFTLGLAAEKTVPLAFAVFGAGCLLFTTRSLVLVILIALGGWLWFARQAGFATGWPYFGGVIFTACGISLLFQRLHLHAIKQMLRATPMADGATANSRVEQDTEDRFRRWYEATFEGIALHEKGVILEANQALATLLRCEASALIGRNLLDWFTRASRDVIEESILLGNFRPFEAVARRPDKTELHVELFTKRISFGGKEVMVTAFRDITERQRAAVALNAEQQRLQQQYRRQLALARLAVTTGESTEVTRILDCIAEAAVTVLSLRGGACIWIHEQDGFAPAASHLVQRLEGFDPTVQLVRVSDWVREHRESFVASDITRDDPFEVNFPVEFVSAYVAKPLFDGDQLLGILFVLESNEPRQFKSDELDFINELANRATVAVAKSRLYSQLSEANERLQKQRALLLLQNEELSQAKATAEAASDAKSELLAKVSQQLREPVNRVIGKANYLLTTRLDGEQQESVESVRTSAETLLTQIDRVLDFSRFGAGPFHPDLAPFDERTLASHGAVSNIIVPLEVMATRTPLSAS